MQHYSNEELLEELNERMRKGLDREKVLDVIGRLPDDLDSQLTNKFGNNYHNFIDILKIMGPVRAMDLESDNVRIFWNNDPQRD